MVNVNIDNEHVSTGLEKDEFYVTPNLVNPLKYTKTPQSAPTVAEYEDSNNSIYLGFEDGSVSSVDVDSGLINWTVSIDTLKIEDVSANSDNIYAVTENKIQALDNTGSNIWSVTNSDSFYSVAVLPDGNLQVANGNGDIELRNGNGGSLLQSATRIVKDDRVTCLGRAEDTTDLFVAGVENASKASIVIKRIDGSNSSSFGTSIFESFSRSTRFDKENIRYNAATTDGSRVVASGFLTCANNTRGERTFAVGSDGSELYETGTEYFQLETASDGTLYQHTGDVIEQYETIFASNKVREISSSIPISATAFIAGISDSKVFYITAPTDYNLSDYSNPSVGNKTYKLTISGTGPVIIGNSTVLQSGETGSIEAIIDSGTTINGSCFISGVRIK